LRLVCLAPLALTGCTKENRVVIYCAHDPEFAKPILADFEAMNGLTVDARFDNEANKAVGIIDDLIREAGNPRCDVHWNNEILGTIRLQRQGVLELYDSPSAKPFPAEFRAGDRTWTAFAARARVLVLNTERLTKLGIPEDQWPKGLDDLKDPRWKNEVAISKPLAGTSATQAACLFQVWGKDKAQEWYLALKANGAKFVAGNKLAAEGVGQGQFLIGLTDTDDAVAEVEAGRPVRIVFPDKNPKDAKQGTLFIPNTIALIKGGPNPVGAKKLIDYLLSAQVEKKLAESASRQVPLNPGVQAKLPPGLETPATARPLPVDWAKAADLWDETQTFVRDVLRP
jgi:iron(III) transport system substrate-binding protein